METKKYQVIYADPPWKYPDSSHTLLAGENGKGGHWAGKTKDWNSWNERPKGEFKKLYPSLTKEELFKLPVKDLLDKDAACFMWTTDMHLPQALEIMKSWGFTYKNIAFVWEKQTVNGNPVNLMAPWTLKSYEICIFGTKGAMRKYRKDKTIRQMVKAERTRHSAKPQEVADRIVRMFPDCPRIELFARDAKPGWDVWGNEIDNTIEL